MTSSGKKMCSAALVVQISNVFIFTKTSLKIPFACHLVCLSKTCDAVEVFLFCLPSVTKNTVNPARDAWSTNEQKVNSTKSDHNNMPNVEIKGVA